MIPDLVVVALDFYRDPGRFAHLRDPLVPLPPGVTELLAAPAKCLSPDEIDETAATLGARREELAECVPFFAKQVLLGAEGDYYRTLGVSRAADAAQIKQHYHYLMRLFHPDKDVNDERWDDLYAPRINEAYNTLRNSGKRREYDAGLAPDDGFNPAALRQARTEPEMGRPFGMGAKPTSSAGLSPRARWLAVGLLVLVVGLFTLLVATQNRQPALRVDGNTLAAAPVQQISREDIVVRDGQLQYLGDQENTPEEPGFAQPGRDPVESRPGRETVDKLSHASADQRVEEMVRQRVAEARVAALGSRPAQARPKPSRSVQQTAVPDTPATPAPFEVASRDAASGSVEAVTREEPAIAQDPAPAVLASAAAVDVDARIDPVAEEAPDEAEPIVIPASPEQAPVTPVASLESAGEVPDIAPAELDALFSRFVAIYEAGDAEAFASLFARDADTTDARGRRRIRALYADFFRQRETRQMQLETIAWQSVAPDVRVGTTGATISVVSEEGEASVVQTEITFAVSRGSDGLQITGMHY